MKKPLEVLRTTNSNLQLLVRTKEAVNLVPTDVDALVLTEDVYDPILTEFKKINESLKALKKKVLKMKSKHDSATMGMYREVSYEEMVERLGPPPW